MSFLPTGRFERLALAAVVLFLVATLGVAAPEAIKRVQPAPPAPSPTPVPPPPAAVLLPEDLRQALASVVTIVNDTTFGTAFFIDAQGDLLTNAHLVAGSRTLRIIDNTGGSRSVYVLGTDSQLDIAEVRVQPTGPPLTFGDAGTLQKGDTVMMLASPKNASLPTSTAGILTGAGSTLLRIHADIRPGNAGSPLVGAGGKVLAITVRGRDSSIQEGYALPIGQAASDLSDWHSQPGLLLPLAPLPSTLALRGTDVTATPAGMVSVQSVQPGRVSAGQDSVVTVHGSGFVPGTALHVRFTPIGSQAGGFDGVAVALAGSDTITAKVPAGQAVQDYGIQVTNGDGSVISSAITLTITP